MGVIAVARAIAAPAAAVAAAPHLVAEGCMSRCVDQVQQVVLLLVLSRLPLPSPLLLLLLIITTVLTS
jgi:hypothetical protein